MRKTRFYPIFVLILSVTLASSSCAQAAKAAVKLSAAKITLAVGKSKTLSLKGASGRVKFKIVSGSKNIKLSRKSDTAVKVTALRNGTAKIKASFGKSSYKCAVTVKAARKITLKVNGKSFTAKLNSSKAAAKFYKMLPLTVTMNELNGNEKYHYFDTNFSGSAKTYPNINSGDLMIYGGDCLVLFYDTIKNSPYQYIKIGSLSSVKELARTLGSGNVKIEFKR